MLLVTWPRSPALSIALPSSGGRSTQAVSFQFSIATLCLEGTATIARTSFGQTPHSIATSLETGCRM